MNNIANWIMVILTAVYVVTTVFILRSSKKQNAVAVDIQRQNMSIQLFEQRYRIYTVFNKNLLISNGALTAPTLADAMSIIYSCYFHNTESDALNILWDAEQTIRIELENNNDPVLEKRYRDIKQKIFIEGINISRKEIDDIKQIRFCFEGIKYNLVEGYLEALSELIVRLGRSEKISSETSIDFNNMCDYLNQLKNENIVEELEKQIQISRLVL